MRIMTIHLRLGALLLAGFLAACGGDDDGDGDDGGGDDDGTGAADAGEADSGSSEVDAGIVIECPDGDLGAVGELQNQTTLQLPIDAKQPDGPQQRFLFGEFSTDDSFTIVLFDGRGAFTDGSAAPGTYPLGGEETSLNTCGICMRFCIITDQAEFTLVPTSGELVVDEVDGRMAGSATDMVVQELSLETGDLVDGGCTASAESVSFDAPIVPPLPL
jgi:hypothetical protein